MLSDFFSESFDKPLRIMRRRHDVVAVNLLDPNEIDIPDVGFVQLEDSETGEQMLVDTSNPEFREAFASMMQSRNKSLMSGMQKLNVDMIQLHSMEPFEIPLKKFFHMRQRRIER